MPTTPAEPAAPRAPLALPPPGTALPPGRISRWRAAVRGTGPMAAVVGLAVLLVLGAGEWATQSELDNQWDNLRRSGEVQALALRSI